MVLTELREAVDGDTVFLIGPGEFQPEVLLCHRGSGVTAGEEHPQRRITVQSQLVNARLQ